MNGISWTRKLFRDVQRHEEVFKITHTLYDPEVSPELRYYPKSNTRGNKYKLLNHTFHYDTRKYSFTARSDSIITL